MKIRNKKDTVDTFKKIKLIENRDLEQNLQDVIPELQGSTSIN